MKIDSTYFPTIMPCEESIKLTILESIPKDMRSRVCSIEQDKSGKISIYFDTYFGHGERK